MDVSEKIQKYLLCNPDASVELVAAHCDVTEQEVKRELARVSSNLDLVKAESNVMRDLCKLPPTRARQLLEQHIMMHGGSSMAARNGDDRYKSLSEALHAAYHQSAHGKGDERHSTGQSFDEQPIMSITQVHGVGFPLGQASKKIDEAARMDKEAARTELLGAIVYLAAAWLHLGRD